MSYWSKDRRGLQCYELLVRKETFVISNLEGDHVPLLTQNAYNWYCNHFEIYLLLLPFSYTTIMKVNISVHFRDKQTEAQRGFRT